MSKYDSYKQRFVRVETIKPGISDELATFDWFNFTSTAPAEVFVPDFISILDVRNESWRDRKLRMLRQLATTCTACSMCELGLKGAERNDIVRDPHVFSNRNPSKYVVIGQGPGWNELEKGEPFVGAAGQNFDAELIKNGLTRRKFYITNTIKCFIKDNQKPTKRHVNRCEPFLHMEINLLRPKLVISLGSVAFNQLCPDHDFGKSLGKITKSDKFNISVFAIYHPSPLNLSNITRRKAFAVQMKVLCELIKACDLLYKDQPGFSQI